MIKLFKRFLVIKTIQNKRIVTRIENSCIETIGTIAEFYNKRKKELIEKEMDFAEYRNRKERESQELRLIIQRLNEHNSDQKIFYKKVLNNIGVVFKKQQDFDHDSVEFERQVKKVMM